MQSNKYKHACYWFNKFMKPALECENFVKLTNILRDEAKGHVRSVREKQDLPKAT